MGHPHNTTSAVTVVDRLLQEATDRCLVATLAGEGVPAIQSLR